MSGAGDGNLISQEAVILQLERLLRIARGDDSEPTARLNFNMDDQVLQAAKMIYRSRRRRQSYFGYLEFEFGEPSWDIMLDLFIAEREGRAISVSSAVIASAVPPTTGLRWLKTMEEREQIVRVPDERDLRRSFVRLTEQSRRAMADFLAAEVLPSRSARP
jgi:hypothetical protein